MTASDRITTPVASRDVHTLDLTHFKKAIEDVRAHEHPQHEDFYCVNLLCWLGERARFLVDEIERLREKIEDRRMRLVAAESDLLNIRGILSPNGGADRVPMELVPEVAPAIEWLVAELEKQEITAESMTLSLKRRVEEARILKADTLAEAVDFLLEQGHADAADVLSRIGDLR